MSKTLLNILDVVCIILFYFSYVLGFSYNILGFCLVVGGDMLTIFQKLCLKQQIKSSRRDLRLRGANACCTYIQTWIAWVISACTGICNTFPTLCVKTKKSKLTARSQIARRDLRFHLSWVIGPGPGPALEPYCLQQLDKTQTYYTKTPTYYTKT